VSDDIFDKLDSLMHKHRAERIERKEQEPPSATGDVAGEEEEIPLLTDEVPPEALITAPIPVLTEIVAEGEAPQELVEEAVLPVADGDEPALEPEPDVAVETPAVSSPEAGEPLADLERQLMEAVENRIAPRLASRLDLALGELLDQFRGEIERMVKDAVASELQQYLDTLGDDRRSPH
jgi:hypothetical protein